MNESGQKPDDQIRGSNLSAGAPTKQSSYVEQTAGPVVGIVIIIIVLGFGALYFWGSWISSRQKESSLPLINIPAQDEDQVKVIFSTTTSTTTPGTIAPKR